MFQVSCFMFQEELEQQAEEIQNDDSFSNHAFEDSLDLDVDLDELPL